MEIPKYIPNIANMVTPHGRMTTPTTNNMDWKDGYLVNSEEITSHIFIEKN